MAAVRVWGSAALVVLVLEASLVVTLALVEVQALVVLVGLAVSVRLEFQGKVVGLAWGLLLDFLAL